MRRNSQKKHLRLGTEIQGSYDFSVSSAVAFHFPMRFKTQSGQLLVGSAGHLRMSVLCFLYFYFYCSFKQTIQLKDEPCGLFNSFFFFKKNIYLCFAWEGKLSVLHLSLHLSPFYSALELEHVQFPLPKMPNIFYERIWFRVTNYPSLPGTVLVQH